MINLIRQQPFYAHLLNQLQPLEDPQVAIAGCSLSQGKINLHLNSAVFSQLTLENQTYIVVHELLHLINRHTTRIQNRQQALWNIACDAAVNQYIDGIPIKQKVRLTLSHGQGELGEEREVGGITLDNIILPDGSKAVLPPHGFAEQYYNLLVQQAGGEAASLSLSGASWGQSGGAEGQKCLNGAADLHPAWSADQSSCQAVDEAVICQMVEQAANRCQGKLPGHLQESIGRLLKSQTPWRRILQLFLVRQTSEHRFATFKKTNKRLYQYELPGLKRERRLKIIAAVDTSGSINTQELAGFAAEVERIRRCGAEVILIECDCRIQRVYPLKRRIDLTFQGRGGTNFSPVWEYIQSQGLRPDVIIYLTDGRGQAPAVSPYPTIWALTADGVLPWMSSQGEVKEVNWGKVVRLNLP